VGHPNIKNAHTTSEMYSFGPTGAHQKAHQYD